MSSTFLTIWGYELSYLELIAVMASFIGVALGITGKRITWPWWALSSVLYGILFFQWELYASAALQIVFIIAAVVGWFGWEPSGAKPGRLKNNHRAYVVIAIILATLALAPLLKYWGAASTYADAILFFGSLSAQILMVYEKFESWIIWLVVDLVGTALYFNQGYYFTSFLYAIFTLIALQGWRRWYADQRSTSRPI